MLRPPYRIQSGELSVRNMRVDCVVRQILAASALAFAAPSVVFGAAESADATSGELEEVVVTASGGDKTQLNSSVAVTSVSADLIKNFQPSSESEVFRMIPGIQVQGTSGPGGNSNIAVRGLPVATGGSPFVQIQEDGLPTVLFGDIQFGNNDYWTHFDASVDRVEGVRGGSSSTFASQAPGAVINYISHTGMKEGGYVALSSGLGFDENRADFRYGARSSDTTYYHVGGYVKNGRGPLDAGYDVSRSAQVKANFTKELAEGNGYIRFLIKLADTQEPNYTGAPALVTLSGKSISNIKPFPGFDGRDSSNYSILNQDFLIVNREGTVERVKTDGITSKALALGNQFHFEFADNIKLDNNMRWTKMSGGFSSPFLNTTRTTSLIGSTVNGGTVAEVRYASGPNGPRTTSPLGDLYTGLYLDNNVNVHTNVRDIGSFANDLGLSGKFDMGAGKLTARAGLFYMNQKIAMDWHVNKSTRELSGNDPAQLDLYDDNGARLTANGIAGFNNNWGNCCARDYDLSYTDKAPYLALDFDAGRFGVDGSVRFENLHASGTTQAGGAEFDTPVTVNGVTTQIPTMLANGTSEYINYSRNYKSWTVGGLFKATDNMSLFARASKGGRFNSDRQTVSGKINADGSLTQAGRTASVDFVTQYELGIKSRGGLGAGRYTAELTLLKGDFKQSTYELSATRCGGNPGGCVIDAKYKSSGAEFFGTFGLGGFSVVGNATLSNAKKQGSDATSFSRADGMPDLIYTISSGYEFDQAADFGLNAGLSVTGQTSAIDGAGNQYPASMTFGGYVRVRPMQNLELGIQGYNLFNKFDLRGNGGVADGSVTPTVIGGAPAIGRTFMGTIKLMF
jgi:outer membrane receptor protein involved in Fe transport